jgi:hypothetical protein
MKPGRRPVQSPLSATTTSADAARRTGM